MAVSSTAVFSEISTQQPTSWFDIFLAEGGGFLTWQGGWEWISLTTTRIMAREEAQQGG
jgi:hypothetical protein